MTRKMTMKDSPLAGRGPGGTEGFIRIAGRRPTSFFFLLLIALFFFSGSACGAERVVLQLRWDHQFQFAGYYAALWQGYYREAGIDVDIRSAITPEKKILRAVTEVAEGRADFGIGAADILSARDRGLPLVLLASVFQQSAARFYALEKRGMRSPADLIKLRVARNVNDLIDIEMQAMLRAEGINPSGVKVYPHEPGIGHLINGRVDVVPGYSTSLPYYARIMGLHLSSLVPASYGVDFYGDSLFTHERLVREKPEIVESFKQASLRGWRYALDHSFAVAERISRELPRNDRMDDIAGFNRFQIKQIEQLTLYPVVELGHTNEERWLSMHKKMRESGIVNETFDAASFFFNPRRKRLERLEQAARVILPVMVLLLMIAAVSLFWNRRLTREIVERKQAEASLMESEERFRRIYENTTVGLARITLDFHIEHANEAYCGMLGYREEELKGKHLREITSPDSAEENLRLQSDLGAGRIDHYRMEKGFLHKSGHRICGLLQASLVRDAEGKPAYFLGSVIDITEMKKLESERLQWERERQQLQKFESLGRMAASIAHYFNNQLGVVIGNMEMAMDTLSSPVGPEHVHFLTEAQKAANKAADMGRLMLTYLGHTSSSELVSFDLAGFYQGNASFFQAGMPSHIHLETDFSSPGPVIRGSKSQMLQVVGNLLANAREAVGESQGKIRIAVTTVAAQDIPSDGRFPVNWQPTGDLYGCVEVADDGCGIAEKDIENLFDPFFSSKFLGRGMGLSVVQGIVRAHKGCVNVKSKLKEGSTFRVFLPVAAAESIEERDRTTEVDRREN